tara:strand:- start:332 stop:742 length:411 start_codon:yes stop_codon:yes gene_type:complete
VIEKKTFIGPAPSPWAVFSRLESISDIDTIIARAIRGNDIIAVTSVAAIHVNMILNPNKLVVILPIGPFIPNITKTKKPISVGGIAKGMVINISKAELPRIRFFTINQLNNNAIGKLIIVAIIAICIERTIGNIIL